MNVRELRKILNEFDDNCEVVIVGKEQDNAYEIIDYATCEDKTSEYFRKYIDLIIDLEE